MAKFKEKIKARKLRRHGESIREIARKLKVSKGSVSRWCGDIQLTLTQTKRLEKRMKDGRYRGRIKGAKIQKEKRLKEIYRLRVEGRELIGEPSKRDLMLFGLGLYWGDGTKEGRVKVSNSNPNIIKFAINWLILVWGISKESLTVHIHINEVHKNRVLKVENYWSELTGISKDQFTKTTLIKAKNKKVYSNFHDYYGTAMIIVQKSGDMLHKILGSITKVSRESHNLKEDKG